LFAWPYLTGRKKWWVHQAGPPSSSERSQELL